MSLQEKDIDAVWKKLKQNMISMKPNECWIPKYAPTKKAGYTQIRFNNIKHYCHVVAASFKYRRPPS